MFNARDIIDGIPTEIMRLVFNPNEMLRVS